jgi:cell division septal protein FtsQ
VRHLRFISIFAAAFVIGTGLLLSSFHQMGLFIVKGIPVEIVGVGASQQREAPGPQGLKDRVQKNLAGFGKKKIWEIQLREVKAMILKDEWVKDVLISRSLPNSVKVRIVPKTTALVLVGPKGELWPVTEEGTRLATLPADALPDVPLLRGDVFMKNEAKRKEAIEFALSLPENGTINQRNVSEIFWDKEDGYSLMLMQPKVEVKLGNDGLSTKVLRVGQVMNYMNAHQLKGRVIDASFSKKVLVRLRKGP